MIRIPPTFGFDFFGIESDEQRKNREETERQEALKKAALSPEELKMQEEKERSQKEEYARPEKIYEAKGNKKLVFKMKRSPVNRNQEIKY